MGKGRKKRSNQKLWFSGGSRKIILIDEELRTMEGSEDSLETLPCGEPINNLDQYMDYLTENCDVLDLNLAEQQLEMLSSHISKLKAQVGNGTVSVGCSMKCPSEEQVCVLLNDAQEDVGSHVIKDKAPWRKLFVNTLASHGVPLSFILIKVGEGKPNLRIQAKELRKVEMS